MAELAKAYEAKTVDSKWYQFWKDNNYFLANPNSEKPPYCIVMPPPNVTGVLHMGHALASTLEDILIRWKRMSGYEVLWVPGTDHAGIATQTVVERNLMKSTGKRRKDFTREEFLEHVWKWKEHSQGRILGQLEKLGCSCDWSRLRFTMDEGNNHAVRAMFKKLYDAGLIIRGNYLVNWDPLTQTALADDEVEYEERFSSLWHFKYPLADGSGHIVIATTRPETMLGDVAVAVSPKDQRYKHLIGKMIKLPLMDRLIPIIEDSHVDPEFGTGAVKITPAHDHNDYVMGLNHKLPQINIMTPDGFLNENCGEFTGLTMEKGRIAVINALQQLGLVEKIEPHVNRVGVSYRSKAVIEPYLSKQWFVRMTEFGRKMRSAVADEKTKIVPKNWESTYFHWIDNLRDWCISRQLWWGHRIPIWYNKHDPEKMICYIEEGMPPEVQASPQDWIQEDDVLDTWFSSALWPFSTLGWPDQTPELKKFYPNSVLETGHDILFFWVARMVMMGEYAMGDVPFPEVFLHGLIYGKSYWRNSPDGGIVYVSEEERRSYDLGKLIPEGVFFRWEKMSKSKGNIIDPLEIIEEYGTDAMRMALCASASQAREIDLDRRRFEEFKNFANKIWNGARFVMMNLEGDIAQGTTPLTAAELSEGLDMNQFTLEDHWIFSALNHAVKEVNSKLSDYLFDQSAIKAYDFFWKEFCSYYVEIVKPVLFGKSGTPEQRKNKQKILTIVLNQTLRLMHPMAPFITEELFHLLKERLAGVALSENVTVDPYTKECIEALNCDACIVAPYPKVIRETDINPKIEETFALMERIVYAIRNIRGEMKLPPSTATEVHFIGSLQDEKLNLLRQNRSIISALVRTSLVEFHCNDPVKGFNSTAIVDGIKILIPLPDALIEQEKARLSKENERLKISIEKVRGQLSNSDFAANAPPQLIEKHKQMLQQAEQEQSDIAMKLKQLLAGEVND